VGVVNDGTEMTATKLCALCRWFPASRRSEYVMYCPHPEVMDTAN
jgi:hypothetical protein